VDGAVRYSPFNRGLAQQKWIGKKPGDRTRGQEPGQGNQGTDGTFTSFFPKLKQPGPEALYPRTLIFENDSTARLGVGRPIDSAGRKVVKISMRFTCGSTSFESFGSERIR
jgi:hypothetical protein